MRLPENIHSVSGSLGFQVTLLGRCHVAHCFYRLYLCYPDVCPCAAIVGADADLFGGVEILPTLFAFWVAYIRLRNKRLKQEEKQGRETLPK